MALRGTDPESCVTEYTLVNEETEARILKPETLVPATTSERLERCGLWEEACTTTFQKCAAVPRRARMQGAWTFVSFNSKIESDKEQEDGRRHGRESALRLPIVCSANRPLLDLGNRPILYFGRGCVAGVCAVLLKTRKVRILHVGL